MDELTTSRSASFAWDHQLPCENPSCRSRGKPHANCKCYAMSTNENVSPPPGSFNPAGFARGGCVQDGPHRKSCHFYDGGEALPEPLQPLPQPQDDPSEVLGNAAVTHGLLGLLQDVGRPSMLNPEKNEELLSDAKSQHEWRSNPQELELPKSKGRDLGDHIADADYKSAADLMSQHPLVGQATKANLEPILQRMAGPAVLGEPSSEGFRSGVDYLNSAMKGHNRLDSYSKELLGIDGKEPLKASMEHRDALKDYLRTSQEDPESLLDVGGSLSHYLPQHATQVASTVATANNYLNGIKPKPTQTSPLDRPVPPSKMAEAQFDRQLDIANDPLLLMQHLRNGTLQPNDLQTVKTIFPALYKSMSSKAMEALVTAQTDKKTIPYHQKQGLSLLLGQPLDSTMTPASAQAIIHSAGPQQAQAQPQQKKPKKASGVELKQINMADKMAETPLQRLQTKKV